MSEDSQNCPKCKSPYGYKDANLWVCPECFHEWSTDILEEEENHFLVQLHQAQSQQFQLPLVQIYGSKMRHFNVINISLYAGSVPRGVESLF